MPTDRVHEGPPFTYTGIDFAEPLYVNSESPENRSKAYCCLFTCASTRAVHVELTESLTVTSFSQAFRRFVSRRGLPEKLLTDNAKTFKSASVDVKKIIKSSEVKKYLANRQIDWQFIMEQAPWWGGFWERLVRSVKRCLKKSVGRSLLTFQELRTLVVEATLNNRPLTYIYDDEEEFSYPLTPADLIYGRQIATMPHQRHCNVISTFQPLTKRARYHFRLLKGFTKQWRKDYLLGLREYHRNRTGAIEQSIRVGDIVVLKEEGSARCWWKLAKVTELLKSRDNVVRSAKIQVLNTDAQRRPTVLRRAVQHLIPLEVNHSLRCLKR